MDQSLQAKGTFAVESTSEPYDTEGTGARLFRSSYTKTFQGDIEGTSRVEVLRAMAQGEESAGYVGIERVTGSVHERQGTFVLQHSGTMDRGVLGLSVTVVPGSGHGELAGLRGEMSIEVDQGQHSYVFDYRFED